MRPLFLVLGLGGFLSLVGSAAAQVSVTEDTLAGGAGRIGFPDRMDTYVQSVDEPPASQRVQASEVRLRGANTSIDLSDVEDEGQRAYLVALGPAGGEGLPAAVVDRYLNGRVQQARLELAYAGGCSSTAGQLVVRGVITRVWNPASVRWQDTDLNGTTAPKVQTAGPVLASRTLGMASSDCSGTTLDLEPSAALGLLTGAIGGFLIQWDGDQPLTLFTLDAAAPEDRPKLHVTLDTGPPTVRQLDVLGSRAVRPGGTVTIRANVTDNQPLPDAAVRVHLVGDDPAANRTATASRVGSVWLATVQAPTQEGVYDVRVRATDSDGWTTELGLNASEPRVAVDQSPPTIHEAALGGQIPSTNLTVDEDENATLQATIQEMACRARIDPCLHWELTWNGRSWSGSLGPEARLNRTFPQDRPGSGIARLTVKDLLGHQREHAWNLTVLDRHPPTATPLATSMLGPTLRPTVEEGTSVKIEFRIADDLPVWATLDLAAPGGNSTTVELPPPSPAGVVTHKFQPRVGQYEMRLRLDDGTHEVDLPWGELNVQAAGTPTILLTPATGRIGRTTPIVARVIDLNLDPDDAQVTTWLDGLRVTPDIVRTTRSDGIEFELRLLDLVNGDQVRMHVTATDRNGMAANASASFVVDTEPPRLTRPASGTWFRPGSTIELDAQDDLGYVTNIQILGPGVSMAGAPPLVFSSQVFDTAPTSLLPFNVTLEDDLGNARTVPILLGIDRDPPQASLEFDEGGLWVRVSDTGSGVADVRLDAGVGQDPVQPWELVRESPNAWRPTGFPEVRGGQTVNAWLRARDHAGNEIQMGDSDEPLSVVVPDRSPIVVVERGSPILADRGLVVWQARDPDHDPLQVVLEMVDPSGSRVLTERVNASGSYVIVPVDPGKHIVTLRAIAGGKTSTATTFFYLGPENQTVSRLGVSKRFDPGAPVEIVLRSSGAPETAYVVATSVRDNVSFAGTVTVDGGEIKVTYEGLNRGRYRATLVLVHEPGVVESVDLGSFSVDYTWHAKVSRAIPYALWLIVIVGAVAVVIVTLTVKRSRFRTARER